MSSTSPEVVKWFTRARRFPQLVGRTPDGARLWGGPYTVTQVVGAGAALFLGTQTMGLWAHYGLLGNAGLLLGVTYGLVLALGRIPVGSRNPLSVTAGIGRALSASTTGTLAGRPVKLARPHQVRHRIVVLQTPVAAPAPEPAPAPATPAPAETAAPDAPDAPDPRKPHRHAPAADARRRRTTRPATVPATRVPATKVPAADVDQVPRPTSATARSAPPLSGVQALLAQNPTPAPAAPATPARSSPTPAALRPRPTGSRLVEDL